MTTPTHTPGPWEAAHDFEWEIRSCGPIRADIASLKFSPDGREAADARLIAAAPELLDELKSMVDMFERHVEGRPGPDDAAARWDSARAAIAKAESR